MSDAVTHEILQTMQDGKHTTRIVICGLLVVFCFAVSARSVLAQVNVTARASTTVVCGDGVKDGGEQCDGADLSGASCASRGFFGGTLSCNASCAFNTSACTSASSPPAPSGGGGGGGGGGGYVAPLPSAIFRGVAYPQSNVTLLENGQVAAITQAGPDAKFEIDLSNMSPGTYNMGIWAADSSGNRSIIQSFQISVTSISTSIISGIFLPPTLGADKATVKKGDILTFFGSAAPAATITIIVHSTNDIVVNTTSSKSGSYIYQFPTDDLAYGGHTASAREAVGGSITTDSAVTSFTVGNDNIAAPSMTSHTAALPGDLNGDGKVNIVDFSIMAYWYGRPNPPPAIDLNHDGKIDLIDFSILAYYWTG